MNPAPIFGTSAHPAGWPGNRVLVADGDPIMREMASLRLGALGFDVCPVADGVSARERLSDGDIRLAIIALGIKGIDGFTLIQALRADPVTADLPVVVVTGREDVPAIEQAYRVGATSFLTKPINWPLFENHLRFVLRSHDTEAELRVAQRTAEAASRRKDDLLAIVTHELRTPVHVISGFADLLAREVDGPIGRASYKAYAEQIMAATDGLGRMMSDMIIYSRGLAGRLELSEGDWELRRLMAPLIEKAEDEARTKGILVDWMPGEDPGEITVDKKLISRAIECLVDNAIKFSNADSRIRIGVERDAGGRLVLVIADQGIGMEPGEIARVLEPFVQSDMSLARRANGLGLGLSLARIITEAHDGELEIESQPRQGTTVRIILPKSRIFGE